MWRPRSLSRTDRWLLGVPAFVLVFLPLLCWLVGYLLQDYFDFTLFLLAAVIYWIMVPAMIFGTPLFDPVDIGYSPHGFFGWLVAIAFYCGVSLVVSALARWLTAMWRRRI